MVVVAQILLVLAGIVVLGSALGLARCKTPQDRLHYVGPAAIAAPILIALAVLCQRGLDSSAIKSFLIAGALVLYGPVLTHATGRAIVARGDRD